MYGENIGGISKNIQGILRKHVRRLRKSRQNMNSLFTLIRKTAENFPKKHVLTHIRKLPNVLKAIIEKNGARTKY